jgi:subtilase family serine protease
MCRLFKGLSAPASHHSFTRALRWLRVAALRWVQLLHQRQSLLATFLCFVLVIVGVTANAQTPPQASDGYDEPLIVLQHTKHPLAVEANAIGRTEGNRPFQRMLLVLSPSNARENALKQLLDDQQSENSPNYRRWLTVAEFAKRFGLADADLQSVLAWLQTQGFTIDHIAASKRWVEFSGTSSQVENAFHTKMQYYRVNGKTYLSNSTDLEIPAALAALTRGPLSLNNFGRKSPVHDFRGLAGRDAQGKKIILTPNLTAAAATASYYVTPEDFAAIYDTNGLLKSGIDGSGVSIAIIAQSQIDLSDVQDFRKIFGLKPNDPNVLLSGPDPGVANQSDTEEALLDVEWVGAVALGSTIDLVLAGGTDTTSGVDLAAAYAIDNQVAPIVSDTYGACEQDLGSAGNAFYNALWEQAAAEGITVLVSSGDSGAAGCDSAESNSLAANGLAVNGLASTPYNTAVGTTEFAGTPQASTFWNQTNSSSYPTAVGYIPEAAWNESCDPSQPASNTNCALRNGKLSILAGAGGASSVYPKPAWQFGLGVPAGDARDLPDIALTASNSGTVFCTSLNGSPCQIGPQQKAVGLTLIGGTSGSTPAMAGILALIEQKNGVLQGQINPLLYSLAQAEGNRCNSSNQTNPATSNSCVFYDTTAGNNKVPCAGGSPDCSSTQNQANGLTTGQVAGTGYDLVTGLGSVNATNLAVAWKSSKPMQSASASFSLSVSPNPLAFAAGTTGSGTVTITPSSGFTGTVTLACASGGTFLPAGYSCAFGQTNVTVNNAVATTTLTFTPTSSSTPSGSVRRASAVGPTGLLSGTTALSAGILLLAMLTFRLGGPRNPRNFLAACGLIITVAGLVLGCGGGGGGGPYATTTTIVSTGLDVPFGTPVTFTVTVKPSGSVTPTGLVQLYDNGQVYGSAVKVSAGIATFLATTLPVGVHNLTAAYGGDAHTMASTSAAISQFITGQVPLQISGTNNGNTETVNFTVVVI